MTLSRDLFEAVFLASQAKISPGFTGSYVRYRLEPESNQIVFEGSIPVIVTPNEQGITFAPADFLENSSSPINNS